MLFMFLESLEAYLSEELRLAEQLRQGTTISFFNFKITTKLQ
jgi:hypothetical protein